MAAVIRQAVDRLLADHRDQRARMAAAAGVADSDLGDLAERHDHYLGTG